MLPSVTFLKHALFILLGLSVLCSVYMPSGVSQQDTLITDVSKPVSLICFIRTPQFFILLVVSKDSSCFNVATQTTCLCQNYWNQLFNSACKDWDSVRFQEHTGLTFVLSVNNKVQLVVVTFPSLTWMLWCHISTAPPQNLHNLFTTSQVALQCTHLHNGYYILTAPYSPPADVWNKNTMGLTRMGHTYTIGQQTGGSKKN
jgi:hypothetical protein